MSVLYAFASFFEKRLIFLTNQFDSLLSLLSYHNVTYIFFCFINIMKMVDSFKLCRKTWQSKGKSTTTVSALAYFHNVLAILDL